ncbi:MAG: mechanosensitive ion channel family protein [Acidimicrobiia bacterium]|nr:mechanosensitive ion channel family protein [Acidimicrobiia bacterium]
MFTTQADPDLPPSPEVVAEGCGEDPGAWCERILDWTGEPALAKAADWLFARPLKILLILAVAWIINRLVRRAINRLARRMANPAIPTIGATFGKFTPGMLQATSEVPLRSAARAETMASVLKSIATAIIWALAILTVLGEVGINLGPLIAGAGVAGVALGFGAQSLVKDFLSGIFMLVEDQYGVGDVVDVGEAIGTVEGLTLRTTRLRSVDGAVWHVPNGEIRRVANMSQQWSRVLLDPEVAYGTDIAHAREVIMRVADTLYREPEWTTMILAPPEIWGVERAGPTGIAIRLVMKTKPGEQWAIQRELRHRLKDAFDAEGIDVPFPQQITRFAADEGSANPPFTTSGSGGGTDRPPGPSGGAHEPAKGDPAEPPPA